MVWAVWVLYALHSSRTPIPTFPQPAKKNVRILPELCKFQSKIPGQNRGGNKTWGVPGVFVLLVMASQIFSHFHPDPWEKIPFLTHMFQVGWFNHQLVT